MASNKKPTLEENKISASGWTMPQDVVGELPPPRPEIGADVLAMLDLAWDSTAHRWVGPRFALLLDGGWSTGQEGLFGEITPPEGSWPKQAAVLEPGEVLDVRPWVPRPMDTPVMPTPVSYDATPGGPGNHYKGLGHQAKHGGELFSTPTASTATGADMVQAKFPGNSPDRPDYEEATRIFAEGKPGLWRTPSARDYKGADPKNATGRQVGLNDQVKKEGNTFRGDGKLFATPQHHDGGAGKADRVGRFGTLAGGRNLNDEALAFPIKGALLPTPRGRRGPGPTPAPGRAAACPATSRTRPAYSRPPGPGRSRASPRRPGGPGRSAATSPRRRSSSPSRSAPTGTIPRPSRRTSTSAGRPRTGPARATSRRS